MFIGKILLPKLANIKQTYLVAKQKQINRIGGKISRLLVFGLTQCNVLLVHFVQRIRMKQKRCVFANMRVLLFVVYSKDRMIVWIRTHMCIQNNLIYY